MLPVLHLSGYQFMSLDSLHELRHWCLSQVPLSVRGTIVLSVEGVNFSLSGPVGDLEDYYTAFAHRCGLSCSVRKSYSDGVSFRRFFVKIKAELVSYRAGPMAFVPLPHLSVDDFHRWLSQGSDDAGAPLCLLDVRNYFEYQMGTFRGASTVPTDNFNEFYQKMSRNFIPEGSRVVIFCTGGIRCEKASQWFQERGVAAHQLEGGILKYMEAFGQGLFNGLCFVFDSRVALDGSLTPSA